ncbi:MAG: right-handed parallel beta-helix repeat-containing protein, partial [Streptosporangiaceae bacterium]
RGSGIAFRDDLFEFNELDGLHIHRYSVDSVVVASSASRNGGSGFVVAPSTQATLLQDDVSEHNAGNGYFVNGKPLANGASASGGSVAPGSGTVVKDGAALGNEKIGILVEGGAGTVVEGDQVCSGGTGIAVRDGVTNAVLTGNDIRCSPRSGLSVGPSTPGLMISGNTVVDPRTGVLIRDSGPVELDNNRIAGATVFGVSARGAASKVSGVGNTISGTGFRAIDARADGSTPALAASTTSGWVYHARTTFWSYLFFHPLAALWLGILVLVFLAWAWSHRRRLPAHPYPASTRWRGGPSDTRSGYGVAANPAADRLLAGVAAPAGDARSAEATGWAGEPAPNGRADLAPVPPPPFWGAASTEPFPAATGRGRRVRASADGHAQPGSGNGTRGYGHGRPPGGHQEPGNSRPTVNNGRPETTGRPPWDQLQDAAPSDADGYFGAFSPRPREVDRQ